MVLACQPSPRSVYLEYIVCQGGVTFTSLLFLLGGRRCDIKGHFIGRTFLAEVGASLSEQRGEMLMVSKAEFDETPD